MRARAAPRCVALPGVAKPLLQGSGSLLVARFLAMAGSRVTAQAVAIFCCHCCGAVGGTRCRACGVLVRCVRLRV